MIRRSLLAFAVVTLLGSGCAAPESSDEDAAEGAQAQTKSAPEQCKGFTMQPNRLKVGDKIYNVVIDKTCRFSEGLGAVWSYGIDADDRPFREYSIESSRFPREREAIDEAIKARFLCTKDEARDDYEQITEKVIPDVASGDADSAGRKLKEILLASRPSCRRNPSSAN